jgi:genome maintenance exonuclease 1
VYLTPDGERLPSVTTILGATKDMTHLNEWKNRIGHAKAQQITTEAAGVGTAMHSNLERFIVGEQRQPGNNPVHVQANKMADVIIENGLSKMSEVWAMEQSLYFPGLYSGTTDLIGVHEGEPAVCDHKQTNKPKKAEWVEDYYLQLVAYILAHNEVYGTDIKKGVIFMCSRALEYQEFRLEAKDFNRYQDLWLGKVEEYWSGLK